MAITVKKGYRWSIYVMAVDLEGNPKKFRTRSPAYPYLDLRSALDKAAVLWKAEGRHPAAVNVVMHHWGYKEESSTGYSCMAALKKYGLIEHDGMGENKQIRLSNLALAILLDENPDSPSRIDALRTAAMSPRIHAELWERYGSDLPSDQSLKRYLVLEKSFNEAAVDELLEEYKQTISFAGLNLVSAPAVSAVAFASAAPTSAPAPASAAQGSSQRGASTQPNRYAPVTSAPEAEDLPYDRRQEAAPSTFQPPPRAIGPANGGARREMDSLHPSTRGTGGRDGEFAPPAGAPRNGSYTPRRDESAYGSSNRQPAERESMRYDQDDFGYEEEYRGPVRSNSSFPPASSPLPAPPAGRFASRAGQEPSQAGGHPGGAEAADASDGPRKELPVPLDGDRVALVPYPMTEEDFTLLIATLQLWKKRLVRGQD